MIQQYWHFATSSNAIAFFFCLGSPEATAPQRCGQSPRRRYGPTNSHAGRPSQQQMLPQGAPGSHSQDTATGTSPTRPPASGSMVCTLYNTPPEDFSSCTLNQEDLFE